MCAISLYRLVHARSSSAAILCSLVFLTVAGAASADSWPPPEVKEYRSNNGKYLFRVTPRDWGKHKYGTCRGELFVKNGKQLKPLWSRPLVNNDAPLLAYVSNSGQYVVTISEWANVDFLPVVFYGWKGELVNVYGSLDQILPEAAGGYEILDPATLERHQWLASGLFFFVPNDKYFIVRLWTGKVWLFETESGRLLDEEWDKLVSVWNHLQRKSLLREREGVREYQSLKRLVLFEALRLASSEDARDVHNGLFVLGQYRDKQKESISILLDATKDNTCRIIDRDGTKVREYPIRKAAKKALLSLGEKVPEDVILEEKGDVPQE